MMNANENFPKLINSSPVNQISNEFECIERFWVHTIKIIHVKLNHEMVNKQI